jgi:hypothetical protein
VGVEAQKSGISFGRLEEKTMRGMDGWRWPSGVRLDGCGGENETEALETLLAHLYTCIAYVAYMSKNRDICGFVGMRARVRLFHTHCIFTRRYKMKPVPSPMGIE